VPTRRAAELLERDVDLAFSVRTGPGPLPLVAVVVVGTAALFLLGGPVGTLIWILCLLGLLGLSFASPFRVLALSGDEVWLLGTRNPLSAKPTTVLHHGTRDELRPAGGWVLPVVSFGGERLRFFMPTVKAARLLTRGAPG
jgi:hypothetical protein